MCVCLYTHAYAYKCAYILVSEYIYRASLVAPMVRKICLNGGDLGSIPELGISPGEGNGYPLQYSCLENSMDRGTWCGYSPRDHD